MMNIEKLCASAEACLGWPYASPGTNDQRGIDCSGLLVKSFRDQGASIYHGSNTIYRKYCSEKGMLTSVSQLEPGMAVFKWNPNTPVRFNDGQGDFQHVGLVTSVNPLRIIHASSAAGCVTCDSKIGKWAYWGWLKDVEKAEPAVTDSTIKPSAQSPTPSLSGSIAASQSSTGSSSSGEVTSCKVRIISSGGKVNIRRGNGLEYSRITSVSPGITLEHIATASNGWFAVKIGKQVGWVSGEFAEVIS